MKSFNMYFAIRSINRKLKLKNKSDLRRPNGLSLSCSTGGLQSRATCQECFRGPAEPEGGRGRVQAQPAERSQVGPSVSGPWRCRVERPEFASASFAARHVEGEDHGDRAAEAAALDRRADRAPARAEPGHGQPRAAAVEAEPHPPYRAAAATQPL